MSDSVRPYRQQPTRLPRPWDSPGKNTGVGGCHFLLQCTKVKSESEVAQLYQTPSDPMDCSPPGSSIHGIFQARVLEWVAIAFSKKRLYQLHLMQPQAWPLAWRIPGMGEPGGLPSMGSHRVGHDWNDLAAAADLYILENKTKSRKWNKYFYVPKIYMVSLKKKKKKKEIAYKCSKDCQSIFVDFLVSN